MPRSPVKEDGHADVGPPASGGLIRLEARAPDLGSWLGPTWSMACGVLASNMVAWEGQDWLRLAFLTLLVDAGWGTLWTALASTEWTGAAQRWRSWRKHRAVARLPYTLPGTPGDRVSRWLGRLRAWWQEVFWPTSGSAVQAVLIAVPLTTLLAALLGPELLLLSLAAVALMQLGLIWEKGRGIVPPGWDALIAVTLPWLAGHATFAPVSLRSAGLATLFALAWGSAWKTASALPQALVIGSQLLSAAWLIVLRHPFAAGTVLLLMVPEMGLLAWIPDHLPVKRYVRYTRPWLMAAMLVTALAV